MPLSLDELDALIADDSESPADATTGGQYLTLSELDSLLGAEEGTPSELPPVSEATPEPNPLMDAILKTSAPIPGVPMAETGGMPMDPAEIAARTSAAVGSSAGLGHRELSTREISHADYKELLKRKESGEEVDLSRYRLPSSLPTKEMVRAAQLAVQEREDNEALGWEYYKSWASAAISGEKPPTPLRYAAKRLGKDPSMYNHTFGDIGSGLAMGPYGITAWLVGKGITRQSFYERLGHLVKESEIGILETKHDDEIAAAAKDWGVDKDELKKKLRMEDVRRETIRKKQEAGEMSPWGEEIVSEQAYTENPLYTMPYEHYRRMMYLKPDERSPEDLKEVVADQGRWMKEVAGQFSAADGKAAKEEFYAGVDGDAPKLSPEARHALMSDSGLWDEVKEMAAVAYQYPDKMLQELAAMIVEQGPVMMLTSAGVKKVLTLAKRLKALQTAGKLNYARKAMKDSPEVVARFKRAQETKEAVGKTKEALSRPLMRNIVGEEFAHDVAITEAGGASYEAGRGRRYKMEDRARDFAFGLAFTGPTVFFRTIKDAGKLTARQFDQATRNIKTVAGMENMEGVNQLLPMFHKLSERRALDGREIYIDPDALGFDYFTADELKGMGYPEYAKGLEPGETRKMFKMGATQGSKTTLHPLIGPDGLIEETAHFIQDHIRNMAKKEGGAGEYSSLQAMIEAWENSVWQYAKHHKIDIPLGDETFAQAVTVAMGYADQYSATVRRLVVPDEIMKGVVQIMGDDPVLRGKSFAKGDITGKPAEAFHKKLEETAPPPRDYDAEIKENYRRSNDKSLPQEERVKHRREAKRIGKEKFEELEASASVVLQHIDDEWKAISEHSTHDGLLSHTQTLKEALEEPVQRSPRETAGLQKAYKRAKTKLGKVKSTPKYEKGIRPAYQMKASDAGLQKKIEDHFGITKSMGRAGYITPKGEMLDFGSEFIPEGERGGGIRYQFHDAVGDVMGDIKGWKAVEKFMDMGNVRVAPKMDAGLSLNTAPTSSQRQVMRKYIEHARETESKFELEIQPGQEMPFAMTNERGIDRYGFHRIYDFPFSSQKILKDIDDFFSGVEPAPVSMAAQFHYQMKPIGGKLQNVRVEGKSKPHVRGIPEWAQDMSLKMQKGAARKLYGLMHRYADEGAVAKDWYQESGETIAYLTNGHREDADLLTKLLAVTSPRNTVEGNAADALKIFYDFRRQRNQGVPISKMRLKAGRFPKRVQEAAEKIVRGEDFGGRKMDSFYRNIMSHVDDVFDDKVTADLWLARGMQYFTDSPGEGPKYDFIEGMVRDVAAEKGWTPKQVQAAIWTAVKGRWEQAAPEVLEKGLKKGYSEWVERRGGDGKPQRAIEVKKSRSAHMRFANEMIKAAPELELKSQSFRDAFQNMEGRLTWGVTPGKATKRLSGIHDAPYEQRLAFTLDVFDALHDMHGRNIVFEEIGLLNPDYHYAPGSWRGEVNPSIHFETYSPTRGGRFKAAPTPEARKMLDAAAAALGYLTHQEGVGWHLPRFHGDPAKANGIQLNLAGGKKPMPDDVKALETGVRERVGDEFFEDNMAYIPTEQGPRFLYHTPGKIKGGNKPLSKKAFHDIMVEEGEKALPDFEAGYYHADGNLVTNNPEGVWDQGWEVHPNGEMFEQRVVALVGPDIWGRIKDVVEPKIEKVYRKYQDRYGWGGNRELNPVGENPPGRPGESDGYIPESYQLKDADARGFDVTPERLRDALRRRYQDAFLPVKRIQEDIKAGGGKITEATDVYGKEIVYHGRATTRIEDAEKRFVKPLQRYMRENKITLKMLDDYSSAVFAPQRNQHIAEINPAMPDGGSGITNAAASAILGEFEAMGLTGKMEAARKMLRRMNDERLKVMLEAGLIDAETIKLWRKIGPDYVPLRGFEDMDAQEIAKRVSGVTGGYGDYIKEKRALGRKSRAFSPTANTTAMLMDAYIRAEKNRVGQSFHKMVTENPNPKLWEIDKVEMRPVLDKTTGQVVHRKKNFAKLAENQFPVKIDGKQHIITINDPHLANAMNKMGTAKMGGFLRSLSFYNRMMAAINTSLYPVFMVSNFLRDIQTAGIHMTAESGVKSTARMIKNTPFAVRGILMAEFGKGSGNKWVKIYEQYRNAGGKTGFFGLRTADDIRKEIELSLGGGVWGKAVGTKKALLGPIEKMNTAIENGVRLAAFKEAMDLGLSPEKAAIIAKELTVNFNRKGEVGTMLNALYLFYNASIQGSARMIGALAKSRKVQGMATAAAVQSFVIAEFNRARAGEDESGMNRWDKVYRNSPWAVERNLIWMDGDGTEDYTKVPLPYGYNVFHVLGSAMSDMYHGGNAMDNAKNLALATISAFNPLGSQASKTALGAVLKTVTPSIVQPGMQHILNENFAGIPIRPEQSPYGPEKPASQTFFRGAREISKALAQKANMASGGTIHRPGFIDPSPELMDHYFDTYTGGLGRFFGNTANSIFAAYTGGEVDPKDIPFVNRLRGRMHEGVNQSRFFGIHDDLMQYAADERVIKLHGTPLENEKLKAARKAKKTAVKMSQLNGRIREMEARGKPEVEIEKKRKKRQWLADDFLKWYTENILENKDLRPEQ